VPPYTDYVEVTDDSDLISVVVPVEWVDTDGRMWESSLATGSYDLIGPGLTATPDIDRFVGGWNTPGVFIGASAMISLDDEEMLNSYDFTDGCEYEGRFDYDDGAYTGLYDLYSRCGGTETYLYQIVAEPASQTWIASLQILLVTSADEAAFEQIINSWTVEELAG
jgi:serine protease Do